MFLRRLKREDGEKMLEWMHDPGVQAGFQQDMMHKTLEDVYRFIEKADITWESGSSVHYAIADERDEYLGTISLKEIDRQSRHAEYAISLRSAAQGKGTAQAATWELLRIAFEEQNLERVYLSVLSDNERAIRLYEKCGFVFEGEFRRHLYLNGAFKNWRWYGMLREDYQSAKTREVRG